MLRQWKDHPVLPPNVLFNHCRGAVPPEIGKSIHLMWVKHWLSPPKPVTREPDENCLDILDCPSSPSSIACSTLPSDRLSPVSSVDLSIEHAEGTKLDLPVQDDKQRTISMVLGKMFPNIKIEKITSVQTNQASSSSIDLTLNKNLRKGEKVETITKEGKTLSVPGQPQQRVITLSHRSASTPDFVRPFTIPKNPPQKPVNNPPQLTVISLNLNGKVNIVPQERTRVAQSESHDLKVILSQLTRSSKIHLPSLSKLSPGFRKFYGVRTPPRTSIFYYKNTTVPQACYKACIDSNFDLFVQNIWVPLFKVDLSIDICIESLKGFNHFLVKGYQGVLCNPSVLNTIEIDRAQLLRSQTQLISVAINKLHVLLGLVNIKISEEHKNRLIQLGFVIVETNMQSKPQKYVCFVDWQANQMLTKWPVSL